MPLPQFDPPAFLNDLNADQRNGWSEWISKQFDRARAGNPAQFDFDGPRAQFFNPLLVDLAADNQALDIHWTAFPRNVKVTSVSDRVRWQRADISRDLQDEYCEWSMTRDAVTGKITRVDFTCEGPEYWQYLAQVAPDKVLSLYQQFIGSAVKKSDLFNNAGEYQPRNKWNTSTTSGAMHLVQVNNSLAAEIELAGGSSVVRNVGGRFLTEERELIECGNYGGTERHSDPHIGAMVNSLTRQKADVTLQNPVGLYFNDLVTNGWQTPDGSDAKTYWKYVRGNNGKFVRAVYEVPSSAGFVVGDIKINGKRIEFGAQIADFISIKLTGVAHRFGQSTAVPMTSCRRQRDLGGLESIGPQADTPVVAPNRAMIREHVKLGGTAGTAAEAPQSVADFAAERFEELAVAQQLPVELAIPKIHYEIAETWADAATEGTLELLLAAQRMSNPQAILGPLKDWNKESQKALAANFFLVLDDDEITDIPTLRCIRSKFPKGYRPTEEELRKAYRECSGKS